MKYSADQLAFIETAYRTTPMRELTSAFNQKFGTNQSNGAIKTTTQREKYKSGRTGHFKKGHAPWNTGTKGVMKPNATSFKKGNAPANTKPLGHERICSKDGYILVKIAEPNPYTTAKTRYLAKHQIIWKQHHGPIPPGHVVTFIDDNKLNCDISNLDCISMAENCRRNKMQYSKYPDELKPTVKALAKLITKTHERIR